MINRTFGTLGSLLATLAVATLLVASSATAQTYGTVNLSPGFGSQSLTGVSGGIAGTPGGELNASSYGQSPTGACRGFIAPTPDHLMVLAAPIANLQIQVNATDGGDTTLVISGPGGTYCADDTVGLNPGMTTSFAAGTYSLWLGSYAQGTNHPYTITFTSTGAPMPPTPPTPPMATLMTTSMTPSDPMGTISLAPGFLPDPQTRSGSVTGMIDMNTTPNLYGATCRGYVQPNPDHIMNLMAPFSYLRVHARSGSDTTLVVQDPTGGFWCIDDADGLNPVIDGPWSPGLWRIWVGTYSPGTMAGYTLDFSEAPAGGTTPIPTPMPTPTPTPMMSGLMTTSMVPNDPSGQIVLSTGFLPDPQTRSGSITGSVPAGGLPNAYGGTCRGHTTPNPGHIMNLTTPFDYLRVHVRSTNDTTLIVQGPDGSYWCNDDTDGLNPVIEGPWSPGLWRIWVGTYSQGTAANYTVDFSEFQR